MIYTVEIDWADDTHYIIGLASSLQGAKDMAQRYRDSWVNTPDKPLIWKCYPPDSYVQPPEMTQYWEAYWLPQSKRYTIMEWAGVAP